MGGMKELEARQEAMRAAGREIAAKAGALRQCEDCGDYWDPLGQDLAEAYKLGNALISRGEPVAEPFNGDRRAMTDAIQEAVRDAPEECYCSVRMGRSD